MTLTVEDWPVERLTDYERNPRRNDHAVPRMVETIKAFGFRVPVLARSNGEVIDGHLRLKAARAMGMPSVPVALADDLTDQQVQAFRIAVNRAADWASWDDELLAVELGELTAAGFELGLTGFDPGELSELLGTAPDNTPPPPAAVPEGTYSEQYGVIVICRDAAHQREVYEALQAAGHQLRVVTT